VAQPLFGNRVVRQTQTPTVLQTDRSTTCANFTLSRLYAVTVYLTHKGGFATAAHVALEAEQLIAACPDSVGIAHTLPDGRTPFRPIWKFFIHPTADVAFGIPRYELINSRTGDAFPIKLLSLKSAPPDPGAPISTWSYPLHRLLVDETAGQLLQLQPDVYDGTFEELFSERGPSVKLIPPYYRTSIHLHGGSSGGPVFNFDGEVFGVASCSYDGAEDIAFVTPADALLEIQIPERISEDERGVRTMPLRDVAELGRISAR
jgi:hypothetical protein